MDRIPTASSSSYGARLPVWILLALVVLPANRGWAQPPQRAETLTRTLANLRAGRIDRPILRWQQARSVNLTFYAGQSAVVMPDEPEIERYLKLRQRTGSEAFDYLDALYGRRDDLKALALRDSDSDGVVDFRVSDFYGKFMEGDIDVDGDGVRNLYDAHPFDRTRGGGNDNGNGIHGTTFQDENANGLPDPVDWALQDDDPDRSAIQLGLFRDFEILLVNRNAAFDTVLARAADDAIRRVFRAYFEEHATLPTLRTIAAERTALLNAALAYVEADETSAQFFSQTQSLIVYNTGRVDVALGVLGLLVHEMGHSYHMSLDFDPSGEVEENRRVSFPAPNFVELVKPFGWTSSSYYDGALDDGVEPAPRFVYAGVSEPEFVYRDEPPEAWESWILEIYEELNQSPNYLESSDVASLGIVSDYSLSSPYEWYGDNFIAYVVSVLEEEALKSLAPDANAGAAARRDVDAALRSVWPGFYHRNLAPEVRTYFETTFPLTPSDRRFLAHRYIDPILGRPE